MNPEHTERLEEIRAREKNAEQNAWLAEVAEWIYGCTMNPNRRRDLCDLLTLVREQQANARTVAAKLEGLRREHAIHREGQEDEWCCPAHPAIANNPNHILHGRPCGCGVDNLLLDKCIAELTKGGAE